MNPVIKPISVVLKEAREHKGISLQDAYKATKIHPNTLRALEDGTTLGLSHVYVKSYIKIYAKYLGISQHELDKYFHPEIPKEKKIRLDFPFQAKGEKIKGLSEDNFIFNLFSKIRNYKKIIIIFIVFILAIFGLSKCVHRRGASPLQKSTTKELPVTAAKVKTAKIESKPKDIQKESFPKIDDILRLTIFAELDTWLQVKLDGKVVFKGVLKKSSSETWQAKKSLELWLGNAGTVQLELNGKILPPIGRKGQVLKNVRITKEGLVINK